MEGHNKHFSHIHNLNLHQVPEGNEITCSGCNSSATATVYACWQCNFFLHEQCFRATRSFQHPSHPSHPLTLLPFPTYPSNSFYCNSCNQVGTGFTYCCSDCEFDLHVQCAYNISLSSNLIPRTHILPQQNQTLSFTIPRDQPIPSHSFKQETLPSFNPQHVYIPLQAVTNQTTANDLPIHYPLSNQTPVFNPQNAYSPHQAPTHQHIPIPSPNQQTLPSYNPQYASFPHQAPTSQPIPSSPIPIPNYPTVNETGPSFNAPQYSQIPRPSHTPQPTPSNHTQNYNPINETVQNFNTPQNSQIPSHIPPINETLQNFSHIQNYPPQPSHNPQPIRYPTIDETPPSLNAPQIPHAATHESINPNVPIPTSPPKEETSTSSNSTAGVSNTESLSRHDQLDQVKSQEIMHFSHPHALLLVNPKAGEDSSKCSACEEIITGSRYSCFQSGCDFHLDTSCFGSSQAILHKSHPDHPLTLLPYAGDQYGQFICSACYKDGIGFTYHCTTCEYDLHIKCASLPETVTCNDHVHPLKLIYSCPTKGKDSTFSCDVCGGIVQENWWTYYCQECDYGTHVDCWNCEETAVKESRDEESESSQGNSGLDVQVQMQRLQLEMEMARQTAQMMVSFGQSISNLAG